MDTELKTRARQTLRFLKQYHELERKDCDEAGWIALKYSCTLPQASLKIEAAHEWVRAFARMMYSRNDDVEIEREDTVTRGSDSGWWVTARVWVPDTEGT